MVLTESKRSTRYGFGGHPERTVTGKCFALSCAPETHRVSEREEE